MRILIVESEMPYGRGVRGRSLFWFLSTYFGRRAVKVCTAAQLLKSGPKTFDLVFVGLPTPLGREHLKNLRYDRLALFDLSDFDELIWKDSDRELLCSLTDRCFKTWVDTRWDFPMTMCVAPLRRPARLRLHAMWDSLIHGDQPGGRRERDIDVAFLGAPTRPAGQADESQTPYHQRVEWLLEVNREAPQLNLWGGLTDSPLRAEVEEQFGDLGDLFLPRRVPFGKYFAALTRSKVLLTPHGFAPWTYRHYEAIYAGAAIVTTDFRHIRTLAPLPVENMIHVADHEPVVPAIEQAIQLHEERPESARENRRMVEDYLSHGGYSKRRPRLLERFLSQLEPSFSTQLLEAA